MGNFNRRQIQQEPDFDPWNPGQVVNGDVRAGLDLYEDVYNRPAVINFKHIGEWASHYKYNPEKIRLFVNGTRQFVEYDGAPAEFSDNPGSFTLAPQNSGDVVMMESTTIFRYIVGFSLGVSWAMQTNQALGDGDAVAAGYGETDMSNSTGNRLGPDADGWFFLFNNDTPETQCELVEVRSGTEVAAKTVDITKPLTDWTRRELEVAWYNVGATRYYETYTDDGTQINDLIGETSVDDGKGPLVGNHHVSISVKAGNATSAGSLELDVGSMAVISKGDVETTVRRKTVPFEASLTVTDSYEPVYAFRNSDPDGLVNITITDIRVPEYTANADVFVLAQAFAEENLRDSGGNVLEDSDFFIPPELSANNSSIEVSENVDQFPDSTGTLVTDTSDPGGYQDGFASNYQNAGATRRQAVSQQQRRNVASRDVIVFLAKASATGDIKVEFVTEQTF